MTDAGGSGRGMTGRLARLAFWSILLSLGVMGLKFVAWWLTGSVALYSDALESIVNVIASFLAFVAIRVSSRPPDRTHPFGHHKAEYFSAVAEGMLIVAAALLVLYEVARSFHEQPAFEQLGTGLAVTVAASAINAAWAGVLIRAGRTHRSPALVADGQHILADVYTSVGVVLGLALTVLTGWYILDSLMAVTVALNILWQGWRLIGSSLQGLMDRSVEPHDQALIRRIIAENSPEAIETHDLKTRIAGRATFVEFHLVVDAGMTVRQSHAICDRIEAALRKEFGNLIVTIHVEPDDEAKLTAAAQRQ